MFPIFLRDDGHRRRDNRISLAVSESGERFELQGADAAMRQRIRDLDGETVTIRGTLETRPGVEIRTRRIITVTNIVH